MTDEMANIKEAIIYSTLTQSMNAARIIKSLAIYRTFNRTEREIITFAQHSLLVNIFKLWDSNGYNLFKYIKVENKDDQDYPILKQELKAIQKKYKFIIENNRYWRNKLIAHLDDELDEQMFNNLVGDNLADIQRMILDIDRLLTKYNRFSMPLRYIDVVTINEDLRL